MDRDGEEGAAGGRAVVLALSGRRCALTRPEVSVCLSGPLRAPVCQQGRVRLPLASRAQGRVGAGRLSATVQGGGKVVMAQCGVVLSRSRAQRW